MKKSQPQGRDPNTETLNQRGEIPTPREDSKLKTGNSSRMNPSTPKGRPQSQGQKPYPRGEPKHNENFKP